MGSDCNRLEAAAAEDQDNCCYYWDTVEVVQKQHNCLGRSSADHHYTEDNESIGNGPPDERKCHSEVAEADSCW